MKQLKSELSSFAVKAWVIGRVTFKEIIRDKILYNSLLCGAVLVSLSFLASQLTYATQSRVIVNFGLSLVTLASLAISILISAPMLNREIEHRTAFVILSKPISRFQFLMGKVTGLSMVVFTNWALLSTVFLGIYFLSGGSLHGTLVWALLFVLIQSLWVMALSVMFSSYSTPSISAILSIGVYLIGANVSQIQNFSRKMEEPLRGFFKGLVTIIPNFETFNLGMKTVYEVPIYGPVGILSLVYAGLWMTVFLTFAWFLLERKEI